jgi:LPS export ABC transporter protein LptC
MLLNKKLIAFVLCSFLVSCQAKNNQPEAEKESKFNREIEQGLVLYDATLEQSNSQGEILWRLSTEKVVYTQDQKIAKLEGLTGNLFEKGKIILQVSAKKGEIIKDGQEIYLKDDILAVDPRNKAELRGSYVEWKPEENYFIMQTNIRGNHAKLAITANQAKYDTKKQILELNENIIANTKKPQLQLKTEHLYWQIEQGKIIGDRPLVITRYEEKIVTDKLITEQAEIDLNQNRAVIQGNIEYQSLEPPLQGATNRITWYYKDRQIEANQPIKLFQTKDDMTLTANLAKLNLLEKKVYLQGGVYGEAVDNEAKIYADNLDWDLNKKEISANGNVYYQQINPDFNLQGVKAVGNLSAKNITVTGNYDQKVMTVIYPDD